jgi:hypothetical protein
VPVHSNVQWPYLRHF